MTTALATDTPGLILQGGTNTSGIILQGLITLIVGASLAYITYRLGIRRERIRQQERDIREKLTYGLDDPQRAIDNWWRLNIRGKSAIAPQPESIEDLSDEERNDLYVLTVRIMYLLMWGESLLDELMLTENATEENG